MMKIIVPGKGFTDEPCDVQRRSHLIEVTLLSAALMLGMTSRRAYAFSIADLSQKDASAGVRGALEKGAEIAVQLLGKPDGFWGNDKVRIPLPDWMHKAESAIKMLGRGKDLDELKIGVNRAAEQAVPQSKKLLTDAVKAMSMDDAKTILTGGDNSVTQFFKGKTQEPLTAKFLPIVSSVTDRIGLAKQYNSMADRIKQTGFIKLSADQATVEQHVTHKSLDGLYYMIGEEEKKLRQNPAGAASDIVRKVFGSLK
jgi:hypothetical protein